MHMDVCMYVCICIHVCMYICVCVYIYIYVYVCVNVYMCVCIYICIYGCVCIYVYDTYLSIYMSIYKYVYVYMYVYVYAYMYIYIYIYRMQNGVCPSFPPARARASFVSKNQANILVILPVSPHGSADRESKCSLTGYSAARYSWSLRSLSRLAMS